MKSAFSLLLLAFLAFVSVAVSSCSTAQGFGRDLQFLGRGLEKVAG